MNSTRKPTIALGIATLIMAAGVVIWFATRPDKTSRGVTSASRSVQPVTAIAPVDPSLVAPITADIAEPTPLITEDNVIEVAATRRMIAAHETLRQPEVSDPDSEANRRILETMVMKAIATPGRESAHAP